MSTALRNTGVNAASNLINRRTYDPNRATAVLLPINYDDEAGKGWNWRLSLLIISSKNPNFLVQVRKIS